MKEEKKNESVKLTHYVNIPDRLKFGQTVYIISYFPESAGPEQNNPMMYVISDAHYEVVECRVVSFDHREVYLHSIGFVKRPEVFVDKRRAENKLKQLEDKLKQLEKEKENDSSESEQLHAGGSKLF